MLNLIVYPSNYFFSHFVLISYFQIQATVVYVDHKEKLLTFSLLNHYHNPISDLFPKYKEGQNKTGIVQSVNNKIGIYLGLPKGILGIADVC